MLKYMLILIVFCSPVMADWVSPYAGWLNGPSTDPNYFPIGVWLQDPAHSLRWHNAGVNMYVGLWTGPTVEQLEQLKATDMQTIATQNDTALQYRQVRLSDGRPLIAGYLQQDEPDNAQALPEGGYGPPVPTETIRQLYENIKSRDLTRPVWMNLGQGIAWDNGTWVGQGGHIVPQRDYPQYIAGTDIVSFDIYPMSCGRTATCGDAWRVAMGVDRLQEYSPGDQIVWNCIETGDINANGVCATVEQIRAEVWMSIIHGSRGITYFIHGKSTVSDFDHIALLRPEHAEQLQGFTEINMEIHSLAGVINSEVIKNEINVYEENPDAIVDCMVKVCNDATYVFAVSMRNVISNVRFEFGSIYDAAIEVIGEKRNLSLEDNGFEDNFNGYTAHLYKINALPSPARCGDWGTNYLASDIDRDCYVNMGDLWPIAAHWLRTDCHEPPGCEGSDVNFDGLVDLNEISIIAEQWLDCSDPAQPTCNQNQ